jgi:thiol-disulfide isomerase/thioredoxin
MNFRIRCRRFHTLGSAICLASVVAQSTPTETVLRGEIEKLRVLTPYPDIPPEPQTPREKEGYYDRIKPLLQPYWETEQARLLALASACEQMIKNFPTNPDAGALEKEMADSYIRAMGLASAPRQEEAHHRVEALLSRPDLKAATALRFYNHQVNMIAIMSGDGNLDEIVPVTRYRSEIPKRIQQAVEKFAAHYPRSPELGALSFSAASYLRPERGLASDASAQREEWLNQAENLGDEEIRKEVRLIRSRESAIGKPPPPIAFTGIDGRKVDLKELRGKVVLIDFWATWCGPCVEAIPELKQLYAREHGHGLEVIGISLDSAREKLEASVKENALPWPQHFDGKGWKNEISDRFGVRSIPDLWLIDRAGRVAAINPPELGKSVATLLADLPKRPHN